jgi:Holliday junction DNA helicase RuvA
VIERLEGEFVEVGSGHLLVKVGGVGLRVLVPRSVIDRFGEEPRGRLFTRLLVRDGEPQLYGFAERSERECFDTLLGVSGVGARIALAILSFLTPQDLALAVEAGSTDSLITVPGVGRKLANRIILELKGRLPADLDQPARATGTDLAGIDAVRALTALGYSAADSREAVRQVVQKHGGSPPVLDELLREALVELSRSQR